MKLWNVCFGLCTNRFNPFGSFIAPYCYKLVILIVYNLPLEMCIKLELMFLSIIIFGTYSPDRNIDVEEKSRVKWLSGVEEL